MRAHRAVIATLLLLVPLPVPVAAAAPRHVNLLANPLYARLRADTVQVADLPAPRAACTDEIQLTPLALERTCGDLLATITIYPSAARARAVAAPHAAGVTLLGRILVQVAYQDDLSTPRERRRAARLGALVVARLRADRALAPYR